MSTIEKTIPRSISCVYHKWPQEDHTPERAEILIHELFEDGFHAKTSITVKTGGEEDLNDGAFYDLDCDDVFYLGGERFTGGTLMNLFL